VFILEQVTDRAQDGPVPLKPESTLERRGALNTIKPELAPHPRLASGLMRDPPGRGQLLNQAQAEPTRAPGALGLDPRLEGATRIGDRDSKVVPERCQLKEHRLARTNLGVYDAVGDQLTDDQGGI
jgi:hypothetical protein